ncbi:MAG: COGs COG0840, partial [uncultured Pseudonocardia sp.]
VSEHPRAAQLRAARRRRRGGRRCAPVRAEGERGRPAVGGQRRGARPGRRRRHRRHAGTARLARHDRPAQGPRGGGGESPGPVGGALRPPL